MKWKNFAGGLALTAFAASIVQPAMAQVTTSAIRGVVNNDAGVSVANANVIVTHTPSGTVSTATTNAEGVFSTRGLRVGGPYTVEVSGSGFTPLRVTDIFIGLDETFPLTLTLGGEPERDVIVVTGREVSTGNYLQTGVATNLSAEVLKEVVSIDRDIADAAELDPFASVSFQSGGRKELSIAGANNRYNSLTIDGVALTDRFGLNSNGYPTQRSPISFDAIESLSVQSAPYDTEFNGFTGGTINVVTKSGTNEFHGSGYYFYTDSDLAGDSIRGNTINQTFEEKTWGATLGGPIVQDKLYFFVAYDKFEEAALLRTGPQGSGALNEVNVTAADVDAIRSIVQNRWGFDAGGFDGVPPVQDEKILASLDWNITNSQRAKFTYIKTEGNSIQEQTGNSFVGSGPIGFSSAWYDRSEAVESYIGHLFSDWTDNFSTEIKIASTTQATGQDSLGGAEFPLFSVRTSTGVNIQLGPDTFRHANELDQEFLQFKFKAEYLAGNHTFKFGYEREVVDVNNLFGPESEGSYFFSSIANLDAGIASSANYANAITNDENDLRAVWGYTYNSLYFQDVWDILDTLSLQYGLRYDAYSASEEPRANQRFFERYGFSNTNTIDGLSVLMPRVSFTWDAADFLTVRGGIGRFSGGSPSVWVSNSYSNDGVINGSVSRRTATGATPNIRVPFTPDSATGNYVPADMLTQLSSLSPDGPVNALDDTFDIPATWKAGLGAAFFVDLGPSKEWLLSADVLYNKLENQPYWYDGRCITTGVAPDGRPIFNCTQGRGPQPILVGSVDKGHSLLFALSAEKNFDFGRFGDLDFNLSYAYQDVNDIGQGNSSTASSNYSDEARFSYEFPTVSTSAFEVEHQIKFRLNYEFELLGDNATRVSLFGQRRSGRPFTYSFNENNSPIFGQAEGSVDDAGHTIYVPSGPSDPLFSPLSFGGNAAQQAAFFNFIDNSKLGQYKGQIAPRNGDTGRWSTVFDLRLEQELPGLLKDHKTILFFDLENIGNLLNDEWGVIENPRYEYKRAVASARIQNGQYVYSNLNTSNNTEILTQSLWQVQLGLKYEF